VILATWRGLLALSASVLCALASAASSAQTVSAQSFDPALYPPWQHEQNNDAASRGVEFTVPDADNLADFHGNPGDPLLALYVGGNYFFAMAPLVAAFEKIHPEFSGRLYWETLPPGLLVEQIKSGGTISVGNMTWTVKADAYLGDLANVERSVDAGLLVAPALRYASNTLTIMVAKGNPLHITGLADLARPEVRLGMPDGRYEGVARQIKESLQKAGGKALESRVYEEKVADGSTTLTRIHHRQTPLWLMQGRIDAGVTWQSEAVFQEQIGHPIGHVSLAPEVNSTGIYGGAVVAGAPHPAAARLWLQFLGSKQAQTIFEGYGFHAIAGPTPG
jgi:ABC-type molybdate transport system substrate-binding protein